MVLRKGQEFTKLVIILVDNCDVCLGPILFGSPQFMGEVGSS